MTFDFVDGVDETFSTDILDAEAANSRRDDDVIVLSCCDYAYYTVYDSPSLAEADE